MLPTYVMVGEAEVALAATVEEACCWPPAGVVPLELALATWPVAGFMQAYSTTGPPTIAVHV